MVAVAGGDGRFLVSEAVGAVVSHLDARSVLAAHLLVRRGAGPVLERWN